MPGAVPSITKLIVFTQQNYLEVAVNLLPRWSLFWSDIICLSLIELHNPRKCVAPHPWPLHPLLDISVDGWRCDPTPVSSGVASLLYESALGAKQYAPIFFFLINQNLNLCLSVSDWWCLPEMLLSLLCFFHFSYQQLLQGQYFFLLFFCPLSSDETLCSRWRCSDVEVTDSWSGRGMNGGSMTHINRQLQAVGRKECVCYSDWKACWPYMHKSHA